MKRRKLAFGLILFFSLLLVLLILARPLLEQIAQKILVTQLAQRANAAVSVDRLFLSYIPPRVVAEGIQIKPNAGPLRYIGVSRVSIVPGAGPIFLGRLAIDLVEIENPVLRFDLQHRTPVVEEPRRKPFRLPSLKDLLRLDVHEVSITGAKLTLWLPGAENVRIVVDAGSASFQGRGSSERWSWQGGGIIRNRDRSLALDRVTIVANRNGRQVDLERVDAEIGGTSLSISGRAFPDLGLKLKLRSELERVEGSLHDLGIIPKPLGLGGKILAQVQVSGDWNDPQWAGEFQAERIAYRGRLLPGLGASVRWNRERLTAASGEIRVGSGSPARFTLSEVTRNRPGTFKLSARDLSYPEVQKIINPDLRDFLFGKLDLEVEGRLGFGAQLFAGKYSVQLPELRLVLPESLRPYLPFAFHDVSVTGEMDWKRSTGVALQDGKVSGGGLTGIYGFEFQRGGQARGTWKAQVNDLAAVFPEGSRIRGNGSVVGGLTTGKGFYRATLDMALPVLTYADDPSTSFDGELEFTKAQVALKRFRVRQGKGSARLDGYVPKSDAKDQTMLMEASFHDLDLGLVADVARRRYPLVPKLAGLLTGDLNLHGDEIRPEGSLHLLAQPLSWNGESFEIGTARLDFAGGVVTLHEARAKSPKREISASGSFGQEGYRQFRVEGQRLPLHVLPLPEWVFRKVNQFNVDVTLDGPSDNPNLTGTFQVLKEAADNTFTREGEGQCSGKATDLAWEIRSPDSKVEASGRVDLVKGSSFVGHGAVRDFSLHPWLPDTVSAVTGSWSLDGNLNERRSLNGFAAVDRFSLAYGEVSFDLPEPARLTIDHGVLDLPAFRLSGTATDLRLRGRLGEGDQLDGEAAGKISLALLTLVNRGIGRTEGDANIALTLAGTLARPLVRGKATVRNGLLQFRNFPHAVESIEIDASLDQQGVFLDRVSARVAEGAVTGRGQLFLASTLAESRIDVEGRAERLNWRFPAWIVANLSGDLSLLGPLAHPTLRGELLIEEATYRDEWDWKSKILSFRRTVRAEKVYRTGDEHLRFDLGLRSKGDTLYLKNNLATAVMRGDLRLTGTDLAMGLLGKIDIVKGEVAFLDNKFEITSGVVTFVSPTSVESTFDVNARTRVQQTDILLDIRSQKEGAMAFLSSQPAKDETNIMALLTMGVDTDELIRASPGEQDISTSVLQGVLAAPVQWKLESGLKKARLVDTFQFVPFFSEDTKSTGLKMIVGRELLPKVRLLYSTDILEPGSEQTIRLEQRFNDNISVQGSVKDNQVQDKEDLSIGLDLEFKFDF